MACSPKHDGRRALVMAHHLHRQPDVALPARALHDFDRAHTFGLGQPVAQVPVQQVGAEIIRPLRRRGAY